MSKKSRQKRQEGLLHEFDGQEFGDCYEEKQVGDKWLVKMWNGGTKRWQVAVYSEESFQKYKGFQNKEPSFEKSEFDYQINKDN